MKSLKWMIVLILFVVLAIPQTCFSQTNKYEIITEDFTATGKFEAKDIEAENIRARLKIETKDIEADGIMKTEELQLKEMRIGNTTLREEDFMNIENLPILEERITMMENNWMEKAFPDLQVLIRGCCNVFYTKEHGTFCNIEIDVYNRSAFNITDTFQVTLTNLLCGLNLTHTLTGLGPGGTAHIVKTIDCECCSGSGSICESEIVCEANTFYAEVDPPTQEYPRGQVIELNEENNYDEKICQWFIQGPPLQPPLPIDGQ
ncbi:MAG: hypothetical protein ACMUJM_15485 [bacterium]